MLNKDGVINTLATSQSRRMWHCPPHFIKIYMDSDVRDGSDAEKAIRWWLYENIESRFFLGTTTTQAGNLLREGYVVAFEKPSDATYFNLIKSKILESSRDW